MVWTYGRTDKWTDRQTGGWTYEQTDWLKAIQKRQTHKRTNEWMNRQTEYRTQTNRQMGI